MDTNISKETLIKNINATWDKFQAYLDSLTEGQLTGPTDAGGWTVKDHAIHLVIWAQSAEGVLKKQLWWQVMEIPEDVAKRWDFDEINDVIFKRYRNLSVSDMKATLQARHNDLLKTLESFTIEQLQQPFSDYQSNADITNPVIEWVITVTYKHYPEHAEWMQAIVESAK